MTETTDALYCYDRPELSGLWHAAREALESPANRTAITVNLPDTATRHEIAALLNCNLPKGSTKRVQLSELDNQLRRDRFGLSLSQVLELLHKKPIVRRESPSAVAQLRRDSIEQSLARALQHYGLHDAPWAPQWITDIRRHGKIEPGVLLDLAKRAAAILDRIDLPDGPNRDWIARGDLAAQLGRGAHALDPGTSLAKLVLRAAAIAHDVPPPKRISEMRELWERCRVALDSVSATVLTHALPCMNDDPWSRALRSRTMLGLPTHLTLRDLDAAPERLVAPGTLVSVCENPRLIDAAIDEGLDSPVVCVSGYLTTPARVLLKRLAANGAEIRYHGDFDNDGLIITKQVLALTRGAPWRMSAADYLEALTQAAEEGIDLAPLDSGVADTPWDPELAHVMRGHDLAIEEEVVLPNLLTDLAP